MVDREAFRAALDDVAEARTQDWVAATPHTIDTLVTQGRLLLDATDTQLVAGAVNKLGDRLAALEQFAAEVRDIVHRSAAPWTHVREALARLDATEKPQPCPICERHHGDPPCELVLD